MMLPILLLAASSPTCATPSAIAAGARLRELPPADLPEWSLQALASGLGRPSGSEIVWLAPCKANIVRTVNGRTLVTADGAAFWTEDGRTLAVRTGAVPPTPSEPPHPDIKHATFLMSESLSTGDWRVGVWRAGKKWLVARYQPGSAVAPVPLLRSALPVLGLTYLGAPDAPGGRLSFMQRVSPSRYRIIAIEWSEAGLRT